MRLIFFKFFFILAIFLTSCTTHKPLQSKAYLVVLKTKEIRFADTAFVDIWDKKASISAYISGKSVLKIDFFSNVCVNSVCMDKDEFNSRFLDYRYYENIFLDIVQGNLLKMDGILEKKEAGFGFVQMIKNEDFDIVYTVSKNQVFFRDRKNRIIIKLKEL